MSRCLPFPPPHYAKSDVGAEAVLEQLELWRKEVESNKRKERKRKKERRKDGHKEDEVKEKRRNDDDGRHEDGRSMNCEGEKDRKRGRKHETPGVEKGTLPVELGQPIIPINVSDCSNKCELACAFGKEKFSTSPSQVLSMNTPHKMDSKGDILETELEYKNLIVNWVPPPIPMVRTDFEDEEWLSRKNLTRSERTQTKHVSSGTGIYQETQPSAHYLPDAGTYVLPYIVPFCPGWKLFGNKGEVKC